MMVRGGGTRSSCCCVCVCVCQGSQRGVGGARVHFISLLYPHFRCHHGHRCKNPSNMRFSVVLVSLSCVLRWVCVVIARWFRGAGDAREILLAP